jgi:hypothetical protein
MMIAVLVAPTTWRCTDPAGRNLTRLLWFLAKLRAQLIFDRRQCGAPNPVSGQKRPSPFSPRQRKCVGRDGTSVSCHKQLSHNATFGDSARLADNDRASNRCDDNRSHDSRSNNAALRHTNRLAIDDGIGRPSTHGDYDKQREPAPDRLTIRNMIIPPPLAEPCRKVAQFRGRLSESPSGDFRPDYIVF